MSQINTKNTKNMIFVKWRDTFIFLCCMAWKIKNHYESTKMSCKNSTNKLNSKMFTPSRVVVIGIVL